jgi:hypothetical protein
MTHNGTTHSSMYGTVTSEEAVGIARGAGSAALAHAKVKLQELKVYAEEGNWTWKIAGFFAGLAIVVTNALSLLSHFFGLSPFAALLDVYAIVFGLIFCALEYKETFMTARARAVIRREALFLYRPYGRAAFYFFVGLLLIAKSGLINFIVGIYAMAVGAIIFTSSRSAVAALDQLRAGMLTEREVALKFAEFDADHSGGLDATELAKLCKSLGATQSLNQLESALFVLDKDADGKITYEEFLSWWLGREDNVV